MSKTETCGHPLPKPPFRWIVRDLAPPHPPEVRNETLMCEWCFNRLLSTPMMRASLVVRDDDAE